MRAHVRHQRAVVQPLRFAADSRSFYDPSGCRLAGKISAAALNIVSGSVSFSTVGTLDDTAYVLATYTSGVTRRHLLERLESAFGYSLD